MTVPRSLLDPSLKPLWLALRRRLDRYGPDRRGATTCPDLSPAGRLTLTSLLGKAATKQIDLAAIEAALVERGIGTDLDEALRLLGYPASAEAEKRRQVRARSEQARDSFRNRVADWPEPWAFEWADDVARVGLLADLDGDGAAALASDSRRLLDEIAANDGTVSRAEVAAGLFGSAHALDPGTRLAAVVAKALRQFVGPLEGRELWDTAGIMIDRVSAPALTWQLPVSGDSPLDRQIRAASEGSLPLHLSLLALRRHPVAVAGGTTVLVVENPRLVEAAVERGVRGSVIAANGNPSNAVTTLLGQLWSCGAVVRYHGDFDAAGIAMTHRLHEAGAIPLSMDASDYLAAIDRAEAAGIRLETDHGRCGPTSWDPALEVAMNERRLVIHEEYVLDQVLDAFNALT